MEKQIKLIIELNCSSELDTFARDFLENSEIQKVIGTKENLDNMMKQDKYSDSYTRNKTIALGDGENFRYSISNITDLCFGTGEIILAKEENKTYLFQQAAKLFCDYYNCPIEDYLKFKNKKSRHVMKKIEKIRRFYPHILDVFKLKRKN